MKGRVDPSGRALVPIAVTAAAHPNPVEMEAWVDTGFTGELVLPQAMISSLGLVQSGTVEAELGYGSFIVMKTYTCSIEWFKANCKSRLWQMREPWHCWVSGFCRATS